MKQRKAVAVVVVVVAIMYSEYPDRCRISAAQDADETADFVQPETLTALEGRCLTETTHKKKTQAAVEGKTERSFVTAKLFTA